MSTPLGQAPLPEVNNRTTLAWVRTSTGMLALGLVGVRLAATSSSPGAVVVGLVTCLLALLLVHAAARRHRRAARATDQGGSVLSPALVALATAVAVTLALTGALLTLTR